MYTQQTLSRLSAEIRRHAEGGEPAFVVWQPESGPPTVVNLSDERAIQEAERLANSSQGKPFFVLQVLSMSVVERPAITTRLPAERDLPF